MTLMSDLLKKGYTFDGASGLKTGANLEDLVTRAVPVSGSQMVDQVYLTDEASATLTDDSGAAVRQFTVKAGSLTADRFSTDADETLLRILGPKLTLTTGQFTSNVSGLSDLTNALDDNDATETAEGTVNPSGLKSITCDLGAVYVGFARILLQAWCNDLGQIVIKCGYATTASFTTSYGNNNLQGDTPLSPYRYMGFLVPIFGRYPGIMVGAGGDDTTKIKINRFDVHGVAV